MKSNRLSKKALLDLGGCSILERVVINLRASKYIDEVIITTTTHSENDPIEAFSRQKSIPFYRGSENNVLDRFWNAAKIFKADIIVRATGDNPFVSYEIADYLIKDHLETAADYTGIERDNLPIGVSTEIISYSALENIIHQDLDFNYSEYMTFYFTNNPNLFSINILPAPSIFFSINPRARLTVDYPEDLDFSRSLVKIIKPGMEPIPLTHILEVIKEKPELAYNNQDLAIIWKDQADLVNKINQITKIN